MDGGGLAAYDVDVVVPASLIRKDRPMRLRFSAASLLLLGLIARPAAVDAQARTLMAVFAHPDDERIVAPLLARYAREGHRIHWVIATDGSKGIRDYFGVPAGPRLAEIRAVESRCAATKIGIPAPTMLGLEDGGLASFDALGRLRREVARLVEEIRPEVIFTIGPEGGTGHPDHRLVGNVTTEVVQAITRPDAPMLYYATLPAERMRDAPRASPNVTSVPEKYLTAQVAFTPRDLEAGLASFACHESQYTAAERQLINAYLTHGWAGRVHLRPWFGAGERKSELF
jgi:LmbE family N-acetylglucosaminyl deacetylase